ncbi:hypothetical protein BZG02_14165 [Labilibaculum filiforme]|uniref:Redox-active disulfide protein 2 n=1 Tax=Labilibaculum filiforme TaxID=1940526 RepID=A0A2N3HVL2_9BACT|nr:hypothetical protein [Labilibaculum filiforme]PKQ62071.1 hypothetical protein BZG02_14165 [Labilibaculum filiforme]
MKFNLQEPDLTNISTEQLQQEAKIIKRVLIAFAIMLILLLFLGIYVSLNNLGLFSLVIVPFILSPIIYVIAKKSFLIKLEIQNREM